MEAQNAESKADFIHKMKIAAKEIEEAHYWLLLIDKSRMPCDVKELLKKLFELKLIVNKIIGTSKRSR